MFLLLLLNSNSLIEMLSSMNTMDPTFSNFINMVIASSVGGFSALRGVFPACLPRVMSGV